MQRVPVMPQVPEEPRQRTDEYRTALVEHPQADAPDEDCGGSPEQDDDDANCPRLEAEDRDYRCCEERLLRSAVALPGKEDRQGAVQDPARRQADDSLVCVEC